MTRKVEELAGPLRTFVADLEAGLRIEREAFEHLYAPRVGGLGFRVGTEEVADRAAWALVAQWLVGYATGSLGSSATIADAEEWFTRAEPSLPRFAPGLAMVPELRTASRDLLFALLPYLLDPLAPGTRRCVLKRGELLEDRIARKTAGIYYTPADVAQYMADAAEASLARSCLDPACGTGVFLRAAQARGSSVAVYGCDVDPRVSEPCAFVLLAGELRALERAHPWRLWHSHRLNLATIDSLRLVPGSRLDELGQRARAREIERTRTSLLQGDSPEPALDHSPSEALGELFPALVDGADVVLCNPPYARIKGQAGGNELAGRFASLRLNHGKTVETSTPFVEHAWSLTTRDAGRAAVVVPLSVAFNSTTQFSLLREAMARQPGRWRCAFFDRTPDALFGDDVKTRNAVLVYDSAGPRGFETTPMLRWTSRTRPDFLAGIQFTDAGELQGSDPIPRLGTEQEAVLYRALRSLPGRLGDSFVRVRSVNLAKDLPSIPNGVLVAPTAYNWLSCARSVDPWRGETDLSSSPLTLIEFADGETADLAYAVLSCRLVYWLWRTEGDAFHVTRGFLRHVPFALARVSATAAEALAALGRGLWASLSRFPVVSVNKGKRTIGFSAANVLELQARIDAGVVEAFSLSDEALAFDLRAWYVANVVVDPTDAARASRLARTQEWARA